MTNQRFLRSEVYVYGLCAVLAAACGGKKNRTAVQANQAIDTQIVAAEADASGNSVKVRYSSNVPGAKFMCKTEIEGQSADWQSCGSDGATVQLIPGTKITFKVKAIGPDGREDADPASRELGSSGAATAAGQVSILNKAEIRSTVTTSSLRLNFGVSGAGIDASSVTYECKLGNEADFKTCPSRDVYEFTQLVNGSYTLTVRAKDSKGNSLGEDSISFKVELSWITGEDSLRNATSGKHTLGFNQALAAGQQVRCTLDNGQPVNCGAAQYASGYPVDLDSMAQRGLTGSHTLRVETLAVQGGAVINTTSIPFCVSSCGGVGSVAGGVATVPAQPIIQDFQVGSSYVYRIPQTMHVTEYATTKTYNQSLSFYRIMTQGPNSDPNYLGTYACNATWDVRLTAPAPNGALFDYCHSTPTRDFYKIMGEARLANNHLEVATNPDLVNASAANHDRILINVFDNNYEFMYPRSRFDQLCSNKRGAIQRTEYPITFNYSFFGEQVRANFFMCVSELSGGFGGGTDQWWVGSFFITSNSLELPLYECFANDWAADARSGLNAGRYPANYKPQFCGQYKNKNVLEVVVMTKKPFMQSANFAQYAQSLFIQNLQQAVPMTR